MSWSGGVPGRGGVVCLVRWGCAWSGGGLPQCLVGYHPPDQAHPPMNRMTNRCKNITLATPSLQPVITTHFTARKRSCGKVMFSKVSVCSQGYLCSHVLFRGWVSMVPGPFWGGRGLYVQREGVGTPIPNPSVTWHLGCHVIQSTSGRYASYWNAFLFALHSLFEHMILDGIEKNNHSFLIFLCAWMVIGRLLNNLWIRYLKNI